MSHNENLPQRAATRHRPAVIAIIVALLVAGLAIFVFGGSEPPADDVSRDESAAEQTTDAIAPAPEPTTQTGTETAPATNN